MVSQDWIEWKDLIELGFKESEFFEYLKAGLEPYEKYTYEHIDCPQGHHRYYHIIDNHTEEYKKYEKELLAILDGDRKVMGDDPNEHPIPRSWKYFVPSTYNECEKIKADLIERAVFKKNVALNIKTKKELPITDLKIEKEQKKEIFPCDPGTTWNDVIITRISNDAVMIETPKGSGRFHFSELKMSDKRSGDMPTTLWTLLMYFCEYTGRITSQTKIYNIQNLSKTRSDLNKKLKSIFGIHENFCKDYNSNDGWVAKCIFQDKIESL